MGAGQSTTNDAPTAASTAEKTSYYTLLGIEHSATEDDIKKAYRRKALELHPDRNYGNVESATALFSEVQTAYEVLSDPQERAWYDAHETQILRGDDPEASGAQPAGGYGNVKMTSSEDLARMLRKFNSGVDFSDAPSGFYGYVREAFEQLAKEEEAAADWEGLDIPDYPSFGHSGDAYEDVPKAFYAVWMSFSTRKSFAWMDKYRLSEAPDRRYRRMMEKENQKSRDQGIRDFNDAVRALVAFVRKRDPRYIPNTQTEAERQKVLRDAAAAQAARARAANAAAMDTEIPEWAKTIQKDENEGGFSESEEEEQHFECVACKKLFKSENQWEAHEKSKKHQKAVYALRKKMQKENQHLNLDSETRSGDVTPMEGEEELDEADYPVMDEADYPMDESNYPMEDTEYPITEDDTAAEKLKHLSLSEQNGNSSDENDDDDEEEEGEGEATTNATTQTPDSNPDTDETSDDDEYAPKSTVLSRLASETLHPPPTSTSTPEANNPSPTQTQPQQPKKGKAAQKRAKKAAAAAAVTAETETAHKCGVCGDVFPSKTQMFSHIKEEGHAVLKEAGGAGGGGKKKKGKGRK